MFDTAGENEKQVCVCDIECARVCVCVHVFMCGWVCMSVFVRVRLLRGLIGETNLDRVMTRIKRPMSLYLDCHPHPLQFPLQVRTHEHSNQMAHSGCP